MSLSYADSLQLESIEAKQITSKGNGENVTGKTDGKNEEELSEDMTFQGLNELIFQRWFDKSPNLKNMEEQFYFLFEYIFSKLIFHI